MCRISLACETMSSNPPGITCSWKSAYRTKKTKWHLGDILLLVIFYELLCICCLDEERGSLGNNGQGVDLLWPASFIKFSDKCGCKQRNKERRRKATFSAVEITANVIISLVFMDLHMEASNRFTPALLVPHHVPI